jgi:hypothetical protein
LCSPGTAAVWEQDSSSVPIGLNYAHVALASDDSGGDCNMWSGKTPRGDRPIGESTTATSGANERVGESLRRPARADLGALQSYQLSITDGSGLIQCVEWSMFYTCLYVQLCL